MSLPRILLTTGEPAGIGPDLCIGIARERFPCALAVIGDPALLASRARLLGERLELRRLTADESLREHEPGCLAVWPTDARPAGDCGVLRIADVAYVLETLARGTRACLDGAFDALVTAPVHKGVIGQAGVRFTGHTEYLAEIAGGDPVMMLMTPGLKVALATTHLPLAEVSRTITRQRLEAVLRTLDGELRRRFGIAHPRILVCGLNPHAGEGGFLGREEIDIIEPTVRSLIGDGLELAGPVPADTAFLPKYLATADAVLAMYHDQGLPVLKYAGFGQAVNVTLGLPVIRTSVDHGTALDLAGTGRAETGSMKAAIEAAIALAARRDLRVAG